MNTYSSAAFYLAHIQFAFRSGFHIFSSHHDRSGKFSRGARGTWVELDGAKTQIVARETNAVMAYPLEPCARISLIENKR